MRLVIRLFALIPSFLLAADGGPRSVHKFGSFSVGALLDGEFEYGCGCAFFYPPATKAKGSQIVSWAEGEPASMFLNGQLLKLNEISPTPYSNRVGERHSIKLISQTVVVTGKLKTTWACPAKSESCEANELQGSIKLQSGAATSAAIPVWGSCGC